METSNKGIEINLDPHISRHREKKNILERAALISTLIAAMISGGCNTPSAPPSSTSENVEVRSSRSPYQTRRYHYDEEESWERGDRWAPEESDSFAEPENKTEINSEIAWKVKWELSQLRNVAAMSDRLKTLFERTERTIDRTIGALQLADPQTLQSGDSEHVPVLTERLFIYCDVNIALVKLEHAVKYSQLGERGDRDVIRRELHQLQSEWRIIADADPEYGR